MDNKTKLKEALKIAFAFALVYGIALKVNWLSPSWAGWSVVAIAATSGAESLAKGFLRIWGTILACVVGIAIISLGAQDRWLFAFLTAGWMFFASYNMLANKKISYFWFCAAYVCLVITAAGPSSSGGFHIAVYRTIETIMGIVVYTLISVFIWPLSNLGAIKKALTALLDTQIQLFNELHQTFDGKKPFDQLRTLGQQQVQQLGQFSQSLKAEGSESYEVQERLHLWNQFESLNKNLLKSLGRLVEGIEDLSNIEKFGNRPEIEAYFEEINNRFMAMSSLLSGDRPDIELNDVKLIAKSLTQQDISHFDKAALAIIVAELNTIEAISGDMVNVALDIADLGKSKLNTSNRPNDAKKSSGFKFPVLDVEHLKGSFFVASVILVGFVIWFYINPPGHSTWYIMGGVFALLFAGAQQIKAVKLIIPFIIAMFLASLIYVFVLPQLTMFYQLGIVLFACMFIIQYVLSGPAAAIFTIAVIQLIAVNNPQSYDPSALLNGFVFVSMLMIYLFGMSYLMNSPRPEKALIKMVSRFFKSAQYLISHQATESNSISFLQRYQTAFYQHELHTLPAKIGAWGKAIDKQLYPNTDPKKIASLVNTLKVLVVRMETLMEAQNGHQEIPLMELSESIDNWKQKLMKIFEGWDNIPETEIASNASELVSRRMKELEEKLKDIVAKNESKIDEEEGIQFYRLLGGYRGVTEATLSFVKIADQLDWKQWKEERFQ